MNNCVCEKSFVPPDRAVTLYLIDFSDVIWVSICEAQFLGPLIPPQHYLFIKSFNSQVSASFWVTCSHSRTSELKPSWNKQFPTSSYEHSPRRAALFVHKRCAQAASVTTKALQDLGTFKPVVEPRSVNSARTLRDLFSESRPSCGSQPVCRDVWRALRYELICAWSLFGMSFITHIFHMLMRVGPCPAGLCAYTLSRGEPWRTASRPSLSETNKAGDDRFVFSFREQRRQVDKRLNSDCCLNEFTPLRWNRCVSTLIQHLNICLQKKTCVRNFWFVIIFLHTTFWTVWRRWQVWGSTSLTEMCWVALVSSQRELSGPSPRHSSVCASVCQSACLVPDFGLC